MPPLISEFHCVQAVYSKQPPSLYATSCLSKVFQGVPASSRFIRANKEGSSDQTASSLAEDQLQEYKICCLQVICRFRDTSKGVDASV